MTDETKTIIEAGLAEVKAKLDAKLSEHTAEIEKHGKAATHLTGEIDKLSGEFKSMQDKLTEIAQRQTAAPTEQKTAKSVGNQFVSDAAFAEAVKAMGSSRHSNLRLEVKNTSITSDLSALFSDGTTVFPQQRQGVIPGDFKPLTVRDVIQTITTSETNSVNALREASFTDSAAEVAQGAVKPESEIEFEQYNVPIQTVAHWIKVSRQLMADAPAIANYIDSRLRYGLARRVDLQLLKGNGVSPNLKGLTSSGNFTAFTPTSGANLVDSINKAKYLQWAATGTMPTAVLVNPADWGAMERTREGSNSGTYLYGAPGTVAGGMPFGVRVVMSINVTAGTFIIGNFDEGATIFQRENAVVEMGYVNDDFTRNLITLRAEERLALAVDRPSMIYYGDITAS
jgi:HK97 family phage major capsid protein